MGLFTFYLGYRHAKKKAARKQKWEEWADSGPDDDSECEVCGYLESQHDDIGRCPQYG